MKIMTKKLNKILNLLKNIKNTKNTKKYITFIITCSIISNASPKCILVFEPGEWFGLDIKELYNDVIQIYHNNNIHNENSTCIEYLQSNTEYDLISQPNFENSESYSAVIGGSTSDNAKYLAPFFKPYKNITNGTLLISPCASDAELATAKVTKWKPIEIIPMNTCSDEKFEHADYHFVRIHPSDFDQCSAVTELMVTLHVKSYSAFKPEVRP